MSEKDILNLRSRTHIDPVSLRAIFHVEQVLCNICNCINDIYRSALLQKWTMQLPKVS